MAIETKQVSIAKEAGDVVALLVEVTKHFKEGKGVSELTELLDDLMTAIGGIDQVDDEWKADPAAVMNSVLLGASDLVAVLTAKKEA